MIIKMIRRGCKHIIVDCKYKENADLTPGKRMKAEIIDSFPCKANL